MQKKQRRSLDLSNELPESLLKRAAMLRSMKHLLQWDKETGAGPGEGTRSGEKIIENRRYSAAGVSGSAAGASAGAADFSAAGASSGLSAASGRSLAALTMSSRPMKG